MPQSLPDPADGDYLVRGGPSESRNVKASAETYKRRFKTDYRISARSYPGLQPDEIVARTLLERPEVLRPYDTYRAATVASVRAVGLLVVRDSPGHAQIVFPGEPTDVELAAIDGAFGAEAPINVPEGGTLK